MARQFDKLNKKNVRMFAGMAIAIVFLGNAISAYSQDVVSLEGRVVNATTDGGILSDAVVTLDIIHNGATAGVAGAVTSTKGAFIFEDIERLSGALYTLSVEYRGVVYKAIYDDSSLGNELTLVVYEDTSEMNDLYVIGHSLILKKIDSSEKLIQVLEMVTLENHGERSFVPDLENEGPMNLLRFSLPEGAANLDVRSSLTGGTILQINVGFAMSTPIPPGVHEIIYTYIFPYEGIVKNFSHSFPLGSDTFRVLMETGLGELRVDGLAVKDPILLEGVEYKYLEGYEIQPGSRIQVEISGLYQPSAILLFLDGLFKDKLATVVIPAGFGLILIGSLVYLFVTHRRRSGKAMADGDAVLDRHSQMELIASLDQRFQDGDIYEDEYVNTRKELKKKILDMDASS